MADVQNPILEHLRQLRSGQDGLRDDLREVKTRLGHLEEQGASVFLQLAGLQGEYATLSTRIDRLDQRLDRVERRLVLTG